MTKKLLLALVLIVNMLSIQSFGTYAAAAPTLTVSNATVLPGGNASVDVSISDNPGFAGYELYVEYDSDRLTANSVTNGKQFASISGMTFVHNLTEKTGSEGKFKVAASVVGDADANGTLFTVDFTVADSVAVGSAIPVNILFKDMYNSTFDTISCNVENGVVNVTDESSTEETTEATTEAPSDKTVAFGVSDANATIGGGSVAVDVTLNANPGIAGYRLYLGYDKEVLTPKRIASGVEGVSVVSNLTESDFVSGGQISVSAEKADGIEGDGTLFTVYFDLNENAAIGTTDVAIDGGEVDLVDYGTLSVSKASGKVTISAPETDPVTVKLSDTKAMIGDKAAVDVVISNNKDLAEYNMVLSFDSNVFTPEEIYTGENFQDFSITGNIKDAAIDKTELDKVEVNGFCINGSSENGVLFTVVFSVSDKAAEGTETIALSGEELIGAQSYDGVKPVYLGSTVTLVKSESDVNSTETSSETTTVDQSGSDGKTTETTTKTSSDPSAETTTQSSGGAASETTTKSGSDVSTETTTMSSGGDKATETTTRTSSDVSTETTTRTSSDVTTEVTTRTSSDVTTEVTTRTSSDSTTETTTRTSGGGRTTETTTRTNSDVSTETTTRASSGGRTTETTTRTSSDVSTETTTRTSSGGRTTETTTRTSSDVPTETTTRTSSDVSTETTTRTNSDVPTETTTRTDSDVPTETTTTEVVTFDNYTYPSEVSADDLEVSDSGELVKFTGAVDSSGTILIGNDVNGKEITSLGGEFLAEAEVSEVILPDNITEISPTAFDNSSGEKAVVFCTYRSKTASTLNGVKDEYNLTVVIIGDLDGDGEVVASDASKLLSFVREAELSSFGSDYGYHSAVNATKSTKLTATSVAKLLLMILMADL